MRGFKKIFAVVLILAILLNNYITANAYSVDEQTLSERIEGTIQKEQSVKTADYYSEVLYSYMKDKTKYPIYEGSDIEVDLFAFTFEGQEPTYGSDGWFLGENTQSVTYSVTVEKSGLYCISINYSSPKNERSVPAVRKVAINGAVQFSEAEMISFPRFFVDASAPYTNAVGDEVRPVQKEVYMSSDLCLEDSMAKYERPFLFYFKEGINEISLIFVEEALNINSIHLTEQKQIPTYEEYKASVAGKKDNSVTLENVQAEDVESIVIKNSSSLLLQSDSDPLIEPYDDYYVRINSFGGSTWDAGGQSITWRFSAPKSGYYQLALRVKQDSGDGMVAKRRIEIDGRVPFSELLSYPFKYSRKWYTEVLSNDKDEQFLFYLEEGEHELRVTVTTAERTAAYHGLNSAITATSELYREITMITGTDPDTNYDYELDNMIPNLKKSFKDIIDTVTKQKDSILNLCNRTPIIVNNLETVCQQFEKLMESPDLIPYRLTYLTDAMTNMGDCLTVLESSAMKVDYFKVAASNENIKDYHSGFFLKFWITVKSLVYSFVKDYSDVGGLLGTNEDAKTIEVWISRGQEWGEILKQLIDTSFTPESGIYTSVRLLPSGSLGSSTNPLLLAINAGNAPDVALGIGAATPPEYAIRNALYDISKFDDFEQVSKNFLDVAFVPFTYQGGVYALPETGTFSVMYYRNDIFEDYGLNVPTTWDDVYYDLMPALNKNSMQFYVPQSYDIFLYQNGGKYYSDDLRTSAFGTTEAYEAFKEYCEIFTNLGAPVAANFFNRFRTGEIPIGISGPDMYLTLLAAAPELTGKWSVTTIPGKLQEDGSINNSYVGGVSTTSVILAQTEYPQESWEFLKWWMKTDTQKNFANTVEGQIGIASRWCSANLEALYSLPWKTGTVEVIKESYEEIKGVPVVPGDYFTARHLKNAFTRVVTEGMSPRDMLEKAEKDINLELERRRIQFGLDS